MKLKIALPNKGSLSEAAAQILRESGYRQRTDDRDLSLIDNDNDVEFYYLRPRDIAVYVGNGELNLGITGRDLLLDSGAQARVILDLDFGKSTFRFAGPQGKDFELKDVSKKRIATAYPRLLKNYLDEKKIEATIVELDGAVESAIALGVADLIADVVSTGSTLRAANLASFGEAITNSEAVLIQGNSKVDQSAVDTLVRRLSGVVIARQYVLVDYDVLKKDLDKACAITPGIESPTISPLQNSEWVAVRAMVKRKEVNSAMDKLWQLGAKGILVSNINSCRL
ncbi:MAG: ATP phosphoribosyltransferase [Actinomycetales bacterium]|nr:ATP phosphoribosyltransferase [Actinomycetales bacterium]